MDSDRLADAVASSCRADGDWSPENARRHLRRLVPLASAEQVAALIDVVTLDRAEIEQTTPLTVVRALLRKLERQRSDVRCQINVLLQEEEALLNRIADYEAAVEALSR